MALKISIICRICLRENEDMIDLFNDTVEYQDQISLNMKLSLCCQIEISPNDCLPHKVCSKCASDVNAAYDLRELCLSNDTALRSYLNITEGFSNREEVLSIRIPPKLTPITPTTQQQPPPLEKGYKNEIRKIVNKKTRRTKNAATIEQDTREKEYICPDCGKSFIFLCLLKEHMVSHTGDKRYLCSVCGKSYGHQTSLTNHMKIHNADKMFKCDTCPLSFHRRSHLIHHKRTHTGEKPFPCTYCGKTFAQSSYLKEHIRVHSGEKPFVCETCGHCFARKSCLIMHRRIHTRELPYPCPDCSKCFSQRSQRKRHVLRSHKGSSALRENGELILREHDQLRAMLTSEIPLPTFASGPSDVYHSSGIMVDLPG